MAMKRCPVCGERYSDTYKNCPFCEEEEYWEEEQETRRPILREGSRGTSRRSAYGIVTPVLIVLIVLMAALLVYLLYGDKLKPSKPSDGDKPGSTEPQKPGVSGTTPAKPDSDGPEDSTGTGTNPAEGTDPVTPPEGGDTPGTGTMPEGGGGSSGGSGTSSGGMSYASAAALPGGLTLNNTDFTRKVSEGAYKLRVSGGTGSYTWISENPSVATVAGDGTVTPVASGTTHVVVTDGSKRAICIVRVTGGGSAPSGSGSTPSGGSGTTTTTPPPSTTTTTPAPSGGGSLKTGRAVVVNGGNGVRVRSGPGTSYDILATVPNGGSVQVVRATGTDDWYEITFTAVGGVTTTGYMKGEFLANS